jgi:hypothetical protein
MIRARSMLVLEVSERVTEQAVLSSISILTSFGAVLYVIAVPTEKGRTVGTDTTEGRVGCCSTGDGHDWRLQCYAG